MENSDSSSADGIRSIAPPRRRIRLTGPSVPVDPRINAIRRDLADIALAGQVFSQHYAIPMVRTAAARTSVLLAPRHDAEAVGTLQAGEAFEVLDLGRDWAWGRCAGPRCVGYVACDALGPS